MSHENAPPRTRRYEGYSHAAMYAEVTDGNDPAAAGELAREWTALADELRGSADALAGLAGQSQEAWQGGAGEAVRAAAHAAGAWSAWAAESCEAVGSAVARQAEDAATARARMPEPLGYDPATLIREAAGSADLGVLAGLADTLEHHRAEAEAARRRAIDVLDARDQALHEAVPPTGIPAPPRLTRDSE